MLSALASACCSAIAKSQWCVYRRAFVMRAAFGGSPAAWVSKWVLPRERIRLSPGPTTGAQLAGRVARIRLAPSGYVAMPSLCLPSDCAHLPQKCRSL